MRDDEKLYMYVYRMILSDIFNSVYSYNSKLPTLSELCLIYNVGRNTIRSALLTLQEEGYITMQRGAQATVIFHHGDEKLNLQYKQTLYDLRNVTRDVFQTMEIILPSIASIALKQATPQQIEMLNERIDSFDIDNIQNESQLVRELFGIYELGFSFLDNPILDNLITTLLYSMFYPNFLDDNSAKMKVLLHRIKVSLKMMVKMSQGNKSYIVKNMIAGLCKVYAKIVDKYTTDTCVGITMKEKKRFVWNVQHEEDYLYMKVVFGVISDINNRVYKKGDMLPSISQISEIYDVSDRTTRRALKSLRDYKVIKTQNGVGSKIIVKTFSNNLKLLKNQEVKEKVDDYRYSAEVAIMINETVIPKVLNQLSKEEFKVLADEIKELDYFSMTYLYDYIYSRTNPCLYTIYKELERYRMWGIFVNMLADLSQYNFVEMKNRIIAAIEKKDVSEICRIVNEITQISINITYVN